MDEYNPYFHDGDGNEVHLGDTVTYTSNRGGRLSVKSGKVTEISYRQADGATAVMVKLTGRTQYMQGELVSIIGNSTLRDKLRRLVADVGGKMDEDAIEKAASSIEDEGKEGE